MPSIGSPASDPRDLLPAVRTFLADHGLLPAGASVVVGVSGGPDSVALLDLLCRLRQELDLTLHVAHLNHRLRGAASDADADFVSGLARSLRLPYHGRATRIRRGKRSLEEAARLARHRFLESVRRRTGADRIALGHTRSDQAETFLIRLLRGAGPQGLAAIRPLRDRIVRPLLDVPRSDVEAYIALRNLETRRDKTNEDPRFLRNRIRHELLPRLSADYAPNLEVRLAHTAELLQQEDEWMERETALAFKRALIYRTKRKIILDANAIFGYHISIQRRTVLRALQGLRIEGNRIGFETVRRVLQGFSTASGTIQIAPGFSVYRSDPYLIFSQAAPPFCVHLPVPGRTRVSPLEAAVCACKRPAAEVRGALKTLGPVRACFDLSALPGALSLRNRRSGDRFRPYGSPGSRKVSDLLIDCKVPAPLRDEVPLLTSGGEILWVVGLRTAQSAAVTARTREVLDIVFQGGMPILAGSASSHKR